MRSDCRVEEIGLAKAQHQKEKLVAIRDVFQNQEGRLAQAELQIIQLRRQVESLEQVIHCKDQQNSLIKDDLTVCIEHLESMSHECKGLRCDIQKEQFKSHQLLQVASQFKNKHLEVEKKLKEDKQRLFLQAQNLKSEAAKTQCSLQQTEAELAATVKALALLKVENQCLRKQISHNRAQADQSSRDAAWAVEKDKRTQGQVAILEKSLADLNRRHDQLLQDFQQLKEDNAKLNQLYSQEVQSRKQTQKRLDQGISRGEKESEERVKLASRYEQLVKENDRCKAGWQDWSMLETRRKKASQRRLQEIDRADQILTNLLAQK